MTIALTHLDTREATDDDPLLFLDFLLALIFGFPRVFFSSPPRGGVMSAPDLEEP
jgi:hypothetical protein